MRNIVIGAALAVCLAAPAEADYDKGPYIGLEGGVWLPNDVKAGGTIQFEGPAVPFTARGKRKVGYDVDVIAGYDWGLIRTEAELSYKRSKNGDVVVSFGDGSSGSGHTTAWSLMGNALLDFGGPGQLNFYAGGGLGYGKFKTPFGVETLKDSGLVWQLIAGVRYEVSRNFDLGVKYRYAHFGKDSYFFENEIGSLSLGANHLRSHSLLASAIYNFGAVEIPPPPPPTPPPPPPPPPATQTCPDGSVILATDACPPPPPPPPPPPEPERG